MENSRKVGASLDPRSERPGFDSIHGLSGTEADCPMLGLTVALTRP